MKRLLFVLMMIGLSLGMASSVMAQETEANADTAAAVEAIEEAAKEEVDLSEVTGADLLAAPTDVPMHEQLKIKFIEGGPMFMGVILLLLILGLAISIERIIYLNLAAINTDRFVRQVDEKIGSEGLESAMELCRNTRGPVASIYYQGLSRADEGIEAVEKSVVSYGSVQTHQLESGLTWVSLCIALAPMFGFMGTVIGMISAFDAIEIAGDIAPSLVAGGIKIALITTVFGLIVAAILQVFYNYLLSRIDSILMSMEDASISLVDILVRHKGRN